MKKLLFGLLILFSFVVVGSAQIGKANKIDEFGVIGCDHMLGRLDTFFTQVTNNFETSKGYIMVYEGKLLMPPYSENSRAFKPRRGEAKARIQTIKDHIKFRNIDNEKIVFVDGGFRNNFTVELWLVPNTATPPQASPTLTKMRYRKGRATDICEGL